MGGIISFGDDYTNWLNQAKKQQKAYEAERQTQLAIDRKERAGQTAREQGIYEHAKSMDVLDRQNAMSIYDRLIPQGQENFKFLADLLTGGGPGGESSFTANFGGVPGVEDRLTALLDDPDSIKQTGAYKFRVGQGQEALQRSLGARGLLGSGNRLTELTKYGQDMASQEYENQFRRLSDLLGDTAQAKASMFGSLANQVYGGLQNYQGQAPGAGGTGAIWGAYTDPAVARYGGQATASAAASQAQGAVEAARAQAQGAAAAARAQAHGAAQQAYYQSTPATLRPGFYNPNVQTLSSWPQR